MNCNKTEVFLSEWYRMCCSFDGNEKKCPVTLGCEIVQCNSCRQLAMTSGDIIDIVQEWSDQHPIRTRLSMLKELLPMYKTCTGSDVPAFCAKFIFGEDIECDKQCVKCWNTPVEDGESNA
jgi:hypothetical protein